MAKYTLNLSEVCEQVSGLKFNELTGMAFDRIDDIANAAIPHLFSSRYTLLDDGDDRIDLERMILEHYWEYEICTYTPSDFILRLNRKLNEIAPLYNQRYDSIKLEYPIFKDVDYTENGTDAHENHVVTSDEGNTKHSDKDITAVVHGGTVGVDSLERGTTKVVDVLDGEQKHTGTVKNDSQEDGTTTVTLDHTEEDKGHTITNAGSHSDNKIHETADHKSTDWDYKNDTPQGSVSGITDQDYLTSYSKHTSEKDQTPFNASGEVSGTYFDGGNFSYTISDQINGQPTHADHMEHDISTGVTDQRQKTSGKTEVDDTTTTLHGKGEEVTTTYNDKVETDNTDTATTTHGKGVATTTTYGNTDTSTTTYGHNIATEAEGTNDLTHEGEYSKAVEGKMNSGKSYMEMLQEYRDVMINIYMEIIEELKELFFIIY